MSDYSYIRSDFFTDCMLGIMLSGSVLCIGLSAAAFRDFLQNNVDLVQRHIHQEQPQQQDQPLQQQLQDDQPQFDENQLNVDQLNVDDGLDFEQLIGLKGPLSVLFENFCLIIVSELFFI